ncbi:MAG TPA: L-threonylcarbamoyladenylate synthase [Candidatus Saccharimonadales bacterium]|nr:L-threonylcarbamoyladenylate synthase [Candidatus Saccharimonadales bacterium]
MSYLTDNFDEQIVSLLKGGGVGLLPSDTIYGLSCRALDEQAVERICRLKGRDSDKPLIVLISDIKMLDLLASHQNPSGAVGNRIAKHQDFGARLSKEMKAITGKYWPGPISFILPMPGVADWLQRGTRTLAIRLPDYPKLLQLINKVGPIISTSANFQGDEPAVTVTEARRAFDDKLDFYVDVGQLNNPPSTLAIVKDGRLVVVRQGAVKLEEQGIYQ